MTGNTAFGVVNVGGLTLSITGSVNLSGSVGGATGSAAVAKIVYATPPPGLQFFDGIDLSTRGVTPPGPSPVPPIPVPSLITVNVQDIMPPSSSELFAGISLASAAIQIINNNPQSSLSNVKVATSKVIPNPELVNAQFSSRFGSLLPNHLFRGLNALELSPAGGIGFANEGLGFGRALGFARGVVSLPLTSSASILGTLVAALVLLLSSISAVLNRARKALVQRNMIDPALISDLSFNVRTQLNNIVSIIDLINDKSLVPVTVEQREYFGDIKSSSDQLNSYIEKLELSKPLHKKSLTTISFEIRTFLGGIKGFAELMKDGKVGQVSHSLREYLNYILSSAHSVLRSINAIDKNDDHSIPKKLMDALKVYLFTSNKSNNIYIRKVSFKLHTSLNNIIGFAELLSNENINPTANENNEYLNEILEGANEIAKLTDELDDKPLNAEILKTIVFDMRTLLDNVIGFASLLKATNSQSTNPDREEYLGYIISSANDVLRTVNDLAIKIETISINVLFKYLSQLFTTSKRKNFAFIATVSFKLRTNLNNIIGYCDLIQTGNLGKLSISQKHLINDILLSANQLNDYLENMYEKPTKVSIQTSINLIANLRTLISNVTSILVLMTDETHSSFSPQMKEYLNDINHSAHEIMKVASEVAERSEIKVNENIFKNASTICFRVKAYMASINTLALIINKVANNDSVNKGLLNSVLNHANDLQEMIKSIEGNKHLSIAVIKQLSVKAHLTLDDLNQFSALILDKNNNLEFNESDQQLLQYVVTSAKLLSEFLDELIDGCSAEKDLLPVILYY